LAVVGRPRFSLKPIFGRYVFSILSEFFRPIETILWSGGREKVDGVLPYGGAALLQYRGVNSRSGDEFSMKLGQGRWLLRAAGECDALSRGHWPLCRRSALASSAPIHAGLRLAYSVKGGCARRIVVGLVFCAKFFAINFGKFAQTEFDFVEFQHWWRIEHPGKSRINCAVSFQSELSAKLKFLS